MNKLKIGEKTFNLKKNLAYFIIFESPLVMLPGDFYIRNDYENNHEDFSHCHGGMDYRMQQLWR